jgi:hypothetical protein
MSYKYKVTFTDKVSNVVEKGYTVIVENNSNRPNEPEIKKAAEADGVKIGGNSISNKYTWEKL